MAYIPDFDPTKSPAFRQLPGFMASLCSRAQVRIVVGLCLAFLVVFNLMGLRLQSFLTPAAQQSHTGAAAADDDEIPNVVHFVKAINDTKNPPTTDFSFTFEEYLSAYSAWYYWRPHAMYIHTNADPSAVARARAGVGGSGSSSSSGNNNNNNNNNNDTSSNTGNKWAMRVLSIPGMRVNHMEMTLVAGNGVALRFRQHISDFMRVQAVHEFGGVYVDFDVQAVRDVAALRRSGFGGVVGRQKDGVVNSGTFMAKRASRMTALWIEAMNRAYDGGWTTHSNDALTRIAERLAAAEEGEEGEEGPEEGDGQPVTGGGAGAGGRGQQVLILEREAFAPGGWDLDDVVDLFGVHNDTSSNLDRFSPGEDPPLYVDPDAAAAAAAAGDDVLSPVLSPAASASAAAGDSSSSHDKGMILRDERPPWARTWHSSYMIHAFCPFWLVRPDLGLPPPITPRYVLARQSNFARATYPVVRDMYRKGLVTLEED